MDKKIEFCRQYVQLSDNTLKSYLLWIDRLCRFSGKDKSTQITVRDIAAFRHSLTKLSPRSHAVACAAINTIYKKVLWKQMPAPFRKNFDVIMKHRPKQTKKLPLADTMILDKPVIFEWLNYIEDPDYHLACSLMYFAGLRISEICTLPLSAVSRLWIQIGDRKIPFPENLEKPLKRQKRLAKKLGSTWLFPSAQNPERHVSKSILQKILHMDRPGDVPSGSGQRTLRASYIVHQLQDGADPIQLALNLGLSNAKQLVPYMEIGGLL